MDKRGAPGVSMAQITVAKDRISLSPTSDTDKIEMR